MMKHAAVYGVIGLVLCLSVASPAKQFKLIEGDGTWCCRTNHEQLGPVDQNWNWKTPVNYDHMYVRYELKEVGEFKGNEKIFIQLCFWNPGETCSGGISFNKTGVYYFRTGRPTWNGGIRDSKYGTISVVHKLGAAGGGWICCGAGYCAKGTDYLCQPSKLKYHVEVWGAEEGTFVNPESWEGAPDINQCKTITVCEGTPTKTIAGRDGSGGLQSFRTVLSRSRGLIGLPPSVRRQTGAVVSLYDLQGAALAKFALTENGNQDIPAGTAAAFKTGPMVGSIRGKNGTNAQFSVIVVP
jgi:hypothetical protein